MAREGTRFEHDQIVFWAENGLIYVEDHRDSSFNAITVKDALKRPAGWPRAFALPRAPAATAWRQKIVPNF
jgi:hypothetical protein